MKLSTDKAKLGDTVIIKRKPRFNFGQEEKLIILDTQEKVDDYNNGRLDYESIK